MNPDHMLAGREAGTQSPGAVLAFPGDYRRMKCVAFTSSTTLPAGSVAHT
jgi:hypothetical protein